ncbi:hypothetical protein BLA28_20890 [Eisenbergiella tayi]|nr:hypothetical protein BLA28_20890 [Eisenbergiella tayi]
MPYTLMKIKNTGTLLSCRYFYILIENRHSKKTLYKPAKHCIILGNQCILSMLICCIIESPAKSAEGFLQGISGIVFWG